MRPDGLDPKVASARLAALAHAAAVLLATALLAGCGEPPVPTQVEVYAHPGYAADGSVEPATGQRESSGNCGTMARYEAHVSRETGSLRVTVLDAAGARTVFDYDDAVADAREITGSAGIWTVRVEWTDFAGAIHAGINC